MKPDQIADHLRRLDGIARGRQLPATRSQLGRAVELGTVLRLRAGVFAVPETPLPIRSAAEHGGELCCTSALRARGIWVLEADERLHVWVGGKGRVHHVRCRCVTHRDGAAAAFGVVSIVHALVQVATCQGAEAFFAAFESAWNRRLLSSADRADVRTRLPARFRWLVDFAAPTSESGLESLLRLRLRHLGVSLERQVWIPTVGRVDFVLAGRIILEVDGRENHDGPSKRHRDLVRDAAAAALGYETLRFDYALVVHDWPTVEAAIRGRADVLGIAVLRRMSDPRG